MFRKLTIKMVSLSMMLSCLGFMMLSAPATEVSAIKWCQRCTPLPNGMIWYCEWTAPSCPPPNVPPPGSANCFEVPSCPI